MCENISYILNKHAHYFTVHGDINYNQLIDCESFYCLPALLLAAANISDIDLDDAANNIHSFTFDEKNNHWVITDGNSNCLPVITESIEQFLSDWQL
ncbi:hypothetical protein [Psychromonas sp. KJ10-2]|uniref:hypothetical protein n=1 Tax=Psychromonas sp. KJ10-2 TaxID=3391822 RepID=UPI0039B5743B